MKQLNRDIHTELYIDVRNKEINIAMLKNRRLIEFNRERTNIGFSVGDIYIGRVRRLMPGLNAAFINIGYSKDAFLHYLDFGSGFKTLDKFTRSGMAGRAEYADSAKIPREPDLDKNGKITSILSVGQYILVQVAKEPISSKGPRLTCEISLPGRNVVLLPFNPKISVSKKIKSAEERNRLSKIVKSIVPSNFGAIVRTVAANKSIDELSKELRQMLDKWNELYKNLPRMKIPSLAIGEIDRTTAILRDMLNSSFDQIVVNEKRTFDEVKSFINDIAPEKTKIVKFYNSQRPIFDHFDIERQIKSTFGKVVPMSKGAYLVIEHTEAAHVIDVNSGNRVNFGQNQEDNALEVNLIAAEEIARQLRLRDMGGIIIVDFIDIHSEISKKLILEKMKLAMNGDRAKYHILPLSKFCLMEITRQRVRPAVDINTSECCPMCKGSGKISASLNIISEIENNLSFIVKKNNTKKITIKVHPFIHSYITKGLFSSIRKSWQRKYERHLKIQPMMAYPYMEYHFFNQDDEELSY